MTEMDELTVSDEQLASILSQEPVQWWVAPIIRELQRFRAMPHPSLPAGHVAVPVSITREHAEAIYNALRQPLGIAQFTGHSITLIQNAVNDVLASLPHNQGEGK